MDISSTNEIKTLGQARPSDTCPERLVRVGWIDPESGERLEIDLVCSEAFLGELESVGFEPLAGKDVSKGDVRGRIRVRPSSEPSGDRSGAGSTHSQPAA